MGFAVPCLSFLGLPGKDKSRVGDPFVVGGVVSIKGYGDAWFRKDGSDVLSQVGAAFVERAVAGLCVPLAICSNDCMAFIVGFAP